MRAVRPKQVALAGALGTAVLAGAASVLVRGASDNIQLAAEFVPVLAAVAFIFMWLYHDAVEYGYRRSALLNIGIVAIALIFVPVYLVRARPRGQRLKPVLMFYLLVVAWMALGLATDFVTDYLVG